jgi:hypothetical protein
MLQLPIVSSVLITISSVLKLYVPFLQSLELWNAETPSAISPAAVNTIVYPYGHYQSYDFEELSAHGIPTIRYIHL